jgi:tyrosinase
MGDFLSPVDPIFVTHHSNIDRLWDVWTGKEQALMKPTLPEANELLTWQQEPFFFYINSMGQPVSQGTAGDYAAIGQFNYFYQPGFGEQVMPKSARPQFAQKLFEATLTTNVLDSQRPTTASFQLPAALTHPAAVAAAPTLFARITPQPPLNRRGVEFHVPVNAPEGVRNVGFTNDSYAGTITFFGNHAHGHNAGPETFDVPLTATVKKLRAAGRLKEDEPLRLQVVADCNGVTLTPFQVPLKSVRIGTF